MGTVTLRAAKTQLSRLIERAAAGEEIAILKGKSPVARLTALAPKSGKRRFGAYRGEFQVPPSFFDPLPEAELSAFEGERDDADPLGHAPTGVADDRPVAKGSRSRRRRKR